MPVSGHSRARTGRPAALLAAALLVLGAASCAADRDPAATGTSDASETSATTASSASDAGGHDPHATIGVQPPEQAVQVTDACTGEGAYILTAGGAVDPALPERGGSRLTLALAGVGQDQGGAAADLTVAIDSDAPKPVAPIHIGERFTVDMWTFSITSICPTQVELDLID